MFSGVNQESVDRSLRFLMGNEADRKARRKARTREIFFAVVGGLFVYLIMSI